MSKKVTYLIGAGASVNAIPVVGEKFNQHICTFCELLLEYSNRTYPAAPEHQEFLRRIIQELPYHYSVDTYARKLFFTKKSDYEAFKFVLSYYFLFEQFVSQNNGITASNSHFENLNKVFPVNRKRVDQRYDVVYAALLDEANGMLPENINVISWNYDCQFEISYSRFLNISIIQAMDKLRVYPRSNSKSETAAQSARFVKLNGVAGLVFNNGSHTERGFSFFDSTSGSEIIQRCIEDVRNTIGMSSSFNKESMLHFAWEKRSEVKAARERAKAILSETDVLIVIGYSFPVYNRRIDKDIFSNFGTSIVYIQGPEERYEQIRGRLMATVVAKCEPECIADLDQFYIPDELLS